MKDLAVYIVCRDRVSDLRRLVDWLEGAGQERLVLIDNASTWEPLRYYLAQSPHQVVWLPENLGSRALWEADLVPEDERFVLTDPDLLPIDECPLNLVEHLCWLLDYYPDFQKAGPGLYIDDLPDLPSREHEISLISPERQLWPGVFDSIIDTTFAVHEPGAAFGFSALRTGFPWQVRHLPWYRDELDEEHSYYREHAILDAPVGTHI